MEAEHQEKFFNAAISLIETQGLNGLSMRPLAALLGTNVATLSRHYGTKAALLNKIIEFAAKQEEDYLNTWRQRLKDCHDLPPLYLAKITEEIIKYRATTGRAVSILKCQMIQRCGLEIGDNKIIENWILTDRNFFAFLGEKCEYKFDFNIETLLLGYFIDEIAHCLTMESFDAYRLIRFSSILRLWQGLFKFKPQKDIFFDDLCQSLGVNLKSAATLSERDKKTGEIVVAIILEKGIAAVTHREVSARSNVPHTTLAYYYPLQDNLVELGMNIIIQKIHQNINQMKNNEPTDTKNSFIGFANYSMAVASVHRNTLIPFVCDMRCRRGENLIGVLNDKYNDHPLLTFDFPAVQFVACSLFGLSVLINSRLIKEEVMHSAIKNVIDFDA